MSQKTKIIVGSVIAVAVIVILALFLRGREAPAGSAAIPTQPTVPSQATVYYGTESIGTAGTLYQAGNPYNSGDIYLATYVSVGTCASSATSTEFSIQNPFGAATSTATVESISGIGQATSTNFLVGTSTASSVNYLTTNISPTLVNATIATGTPQFYISSGLTTGLAANSPGTNSVRTIVVGPSLYLLGFATSTYGNAGALNYKLPALTSCTYKITWKL